MMNVINRQIKTTDLDTLKKPVGKCLTVDEWSTITTEVLKLDPPSNKENNKKSLITKIVKYLEDNTKDIAWLNKMIATHNKNTIARNQNLLNTINNNNKQAEKTPHLQTPKSSPNKMNSNNAQMTPHTQR
eukprot:149907_1